MVLKIEVERRLLPAGEGRDLESIVQAVLANIARFDYVAFGGWTRLQPWEPKTRKLAFITHPPNKIYRVISDNEREGVGAPELLGCIVGYSDGEKGGPAMAYVWILGVFSGMGSYESPIPVAGEVLVDVTERVRSGWRPKTDAIASGG